MQNRPRRSKRAFSSKPDKSVARLLVLAGLAAVAAISLASCAGRNIHPELKADTNVLVRKWTMATHGPFVAGDRGFEYSNPVFSDETLIFGTQSQGLISIYPESLLTRWVLPIQGGVVSELLVERGTVYCGGGDGFLYSVNAETGRVNWRYDLHSPFVSQPTLSGGRLFVASTDDAIYAFDAGTGKWLWHYRRRSSQAATILGASSPLVDGNEVIAGLSDGFLVALSVNDGQLKWERKLHQGTKFTDVDAHPVLENGVIYIPSYDGALYALKRQTGEVIWRFDTGGSKRVLIDDQRLYLPSSDGYVYALQKSNAKVLWKFEIDGGTPTRLVLLDNKHLAFGSTHQYLYVVDKNTGGGLYRFNAGYDSGFSGAPAFDLGSKRLYLLSGAGNLYSFALRQLSLRARPHGMTSPYEF